MTLLTVLFTPLHIFGFVGLIISIIALIKVKKDKNSLRGLAIASVIISAILTIGITISASYYFYNLSQYKQSVTLTNKGGLSKDKFSEVEQLTHQILKRAGYTDYRFNDGENSFTIQFKNYSRDEIINILKENKFEGKIGDKVVFSSVQDVTSVCQNASCMGIDPRYGCKTKDSGEWTCQYFFGMKISDIAAQRFADITRDMEIIKGNNESHLSSNFTITVNDKKVEELLIGSDLKGKTIQDIQISGSGNGTTENEAMKTALVDMSYYRRMFYLGGIPSDVEIK